MSRKNRRDRIWSFKVDGRPSRKIRGDLLFIISCFTVLLWSRPQSSGSPTRTRSFPPVCTAGRWTGLPAAGKIQGSPVPGSIRPGWAFGSRREWAPGAHYGRLPPMLAVSVGTTPLLFFRTYLYHKTPKKGEKPLLFHVFLINLRGFFF